MNNDLTLDSILNIFKKVIIESNNIPPLGSIEDKYWNEEGFEILDEFVFNVYKQGSPTEDWVPGTSNTPDDNPEFQTHWKKQYESLGQIVNQVTEESLSSCGIDIKYLKIAKEMVQYSYDRLGGVLPPEITN